VVYPGLFAYFTPDEEKASRIRIAAVCLAFSAGIAVVGAAITGGLLSLGVVVLRDALGLGNISPNYAGWAALNPFNPIHTPILIVVNYLGWAILWIIGFAYLTGRSLSLPIPRINAPQGLMNMQGYRGGFLYGVFIGGPGQAHCTVTILIPLVFLSLTALDPFAVVVYFGIYTIGRIIPILVSGLMLQDMRLRFTKTVIENGKLINRLIGVSFLIGGLVLFFWL
jgi:cytochrome c biogenesis protein CcdA